MPTKTRNKTRRVSSAHRKLHEIIRLIPGYDPFETALPGQYFDADAGQMACDFFPACLKHVEGAVAGQPFVLEDWQKAIVANIFGWKNADGWRRYREVFLYVPRKDGKTPLAAGIADFVTFCDEEFGQQNVCAAADSDQAGLLFRHAAGMVRQEPELDSRCTIYGDKGGTVRKSIVIPSTNSYLRVISSEANTKHGGNPHLIIIEELHAQANAELVDVLQTSMASANRRQSLLISVTTADFARESVCNEKHDYACKVRDKIFDDPAFLPVIYEADTDDDWTDPEVWAKANPNLGVSVSLEYLERECKRAQELPRLENTFKRLHLNIITEQAVRWLPMDKFDACGGPDNVTELIEKLRGKPCWAGLDLASTNDLCSLALVFRPEFEGDTYKVLLYCWVPGESMELRARRDNVDYPTWQRQGFIEETAGNVADYSRIRAKINELSKIYPIQEIAFDPYNATHITQELEDQDGFRVIEHRQGIISMNEPTKAWERLVLSGGLAHGGNPVLRWAQSNVAIHTDAAGNIKPDKKKSTEKIDPIVAGIMALWRAMKGDGGGSVYDTGDLKVL